MMWYSLKEKKPTERKEYLLKFNNGHYVIAEWRNDNCVCGFAYEDGDYYMKITPNDENVLWTEFPDTNEQYIEFGQEKVEKLYDEIMKEFNNYFDFGDWSDRAKYEFLIEKAYEKGYIDGINKN